MEILSYLQPMYQKQILDNSKYKNKKIGYTEYLLYYKTNLSIIDTNIFEDSFDILICKEGKIIQVISTCIRCVQNIGSSPYQTLNTRFSDKMKYERYYPEFNRNNKQININYVDTENFYNLFTNLKDESLFYSIFDNILNKTKVNREEINNYVIHGGILSNSKYNKEYIISAGKEQTNQEYHRQDIIQEFINHINRDTKDPYNLYYDSEDDSEDKDSEEYNFMHVAKFRVDSDIIYFKKNQY